jgi:hypothetical protein
VTSNASFTRINGSTGSVSAYGTDFYFYDRKFNSSYDLTGKHSTSIMLTFKPVINTLRKYGKKLNKG